MASFAPFSSATLAGSQLKQSCRPLSAGKQPSAANSGAAHCRRKASYLASHNRNAEIQLGWPSAESFFPDDNAPESTGRIDVLGLGQAMIDFGGAVGDEWLTELQVEKGARK